jgi:hypothetical protein
MCVNHNDNILTRKRLDVVTFLIRDNERDATVKRVATPATPTAMPTAMPGKRDASGERVASQVRLKLGVM